MGAKGLGSRAIIGEYYARLEQNIGTEWIDLISMLFTSDQESETYKWLGMAPALRQWIGGRQAKGFRENGITIANLPFEATLEVLVDELRRDKTGQILVRVREMADRTNAHWASLLTALLINAEDHVCYDAQYFFDTDHSEGSSGTQSNDLSIDISALSASVHGSTTAPSIEEVYQCVLQAIQAILGFKDDQGEPMNENAKNYLVMCPVSLYQPIYNAFNQPNLVAAMILAGKQQTQQSGFNVTVLANGRLTWTTKFATFRTDGNVKPLIRQQETPVKMDAIAEGSELEFNEKKHHYGVDCNRNVGYGYWQQGCLVTMT